jgi:hypothetical protein
MKPICKGLLWCTWFNVYDTPGGGSIDLENRILTVDLNCDNWGHSLTFLLHEAQEAAYATRGVRYLPAGNFCYSDTFVFQFSHAEFTLATEDAACFLSQVYAPVYAAWQKKHPRSRR